MKTPDPHTQSLVKPILEGTVALPEGCILPGEGGHHRHGEGMTSIRRATYKGREIEIHTQYRILFDGKEVDLQASVMNDGRVHSHSLPQYTFKSAVDMAEAMIDFFSETAFFEGTADTGDGQSAVADAGHGPSGHH
jgi:hypothetical protein